MFMLRPAELYKISAEKHCLETVTNIQSLNPKAAILRNASRIEAFSELLISENAQKNCCVGVGLPSFQSFGSLKLYERILFT